MMAQDMVGDSLKRAAKAVGIRRVYRHDFAPARMCCERHFLSLFGRSRKRYVGRILCYHSIDQDDEFGVNDVSASKFRMHIEQALNAGHRFVYASEIARTGGGPKDLAITFDDGAKSVATVAAPILKEYGLPWSFFPVSEWSDMKDPRRRDIVMTWNDMETLLKDGAELGSHSATHPNFAMLNPQQIVDELGRSRDTIHRRLGFAPKTFAIPLGQSGNWPQACAKAARDAGYEIIYAQAEETRPADTVARTFVTRYDGGRIFNALLAGKYDSWEEWF
jgi:peptidoglycan/xylan/chitin deacetylase (PgdA/CDA1 family)